MSWERIPTALTPGCGIHSQLSKIEHYPEKGQYRKGYKEDHERMLGALKTIEANAAYRGELLSLNQYSRYDYVYTELMLSSKGRDALAVLNRGEVWNMRAESANHVQTRHYWLSKLDEVILSETDVARIRSLPQPEYQEILRRLTYYLMGCVHRPMPGMMSRKQWVRVEIIHEDGSIDHPFPGKGVLKLSELP